MRNGWWLGFILLSILACSGLLYGQSGSTGNFELEKGLVEKLYRNSTDAANKEAQESENSVSIDPIVSFVSFTDLNLTNRYFTIPYSQDIGNVPLIQISAEAPFYRFAGFSLGGQLKVGYGYKEGIYRVQSLSGMELKDAVKLHWLPATASLKLTYRNFSFVTPSLSIGAGMQLMYQAGRLDGSAQSFWVPFFSVSPAIRIFDLTENRSHWFGGVLLGGTLSNSMGSNQSVRYWSLDIGTSLVL